MWYLKFENLNLGNLDLNLTRCAAGLNPPLLTGNIVSNGISLIIIITVSLIFPDKQPFQWEAFKEKITTSESTVRLPSLKRVAFQKFVKSCHASSTTYGVSFPASCCAHAHVKSRLP